MKSVENKIEEQAAELADLRDRLREAEAVLQAIRRGEVDALVVREGEQIYTLQSADHPYRIFIEQMHEGALTLARDGVVLFCNSRFAAMIRREETEILGQPLSLSFPPKARGRLNELLAQAETAGAAHDEFDLLPKDLPVRLSLSRIELDGQMLYCGIVLDLSTERQAAQLQALAAEEARLRETNIELEERVLKRTAELEHRSRQLHALAVQLSHAEQHERRRVATDIHDYLAQLLVASKMKAGQVRTKHPPAVKLVEELESHLNQAITYTRTLIAQLYPIVLFRSGLPAALEKLAEQMQVYELPVTFDSSDYRAELPEPQAVFIFQSIRELLMNALKHAKAGGVEVTLQSDAQQCRVRVRDNGLGFDLHQYENRHEEKFGLFHLRERLEFMGGRLTIDTAPGRGTTVEIYTPLVGVPLTDEEPELPLEPLLPVPPKPAESFIGVMLVDDHRMIREGLANLIGGELDLRVVGEAGDGETAVRLAQEIQPNVIVMDVNMPRMNGIEATRRIREAQPGTAIIGLSIFDDEEVLRAMRDAGATLLLGKSEASEELCDAIRQAWQALRPNNAALNPKA